MEEARAAKFITPGYLRRSAAWKERIQMAEVKLGLRNIAYDMDRF